MKITIVTQENILDYWSMLSSDEVYGINDNKLNCMIVSDEDGTPAGKLTVQIYPEYIRIKNIYIIPEYRRRGFATALLDFIKKRPKEANLPIRAFLEEWQDLRILLEKSGFTEEKCDYSVITVSLKDFPDPYGLVKKKFPEGAVSKYRLLRMDRVPLNAVQHFILSSPHDEILLFPDKTLDLNRFSDGSVICEKGGQIEAVSLIEDTDDYTQFTWAHGKDTLALLLCIVAARKDLVAEYGPDYRIRCLCWNEAMQKVYEKTFSDFDQTQIKIYRFEG